MDPLLVIEIVNVVFGIAVLAVLALGLAIIFGLLGVLNIAHGEFVMVGAYAAYVAAAAGWPFVAALPLALAMSGGLGFVIERSIIRPLYRRPFDTLVATWGLSLLLRRVAEAIFGSGFRDVPLPVKGAIDILGVSYPAYRVLFIVIAFVLYALLAGWFAMSRVGDHVRAMVGNRELALAVGIPANRLATATFVTGTCLAGLGGALIAPLVPIEPFMGIDYTLNSFFILVVGGLGSIAGLSSGSVIIGGLDSIMSAAFDATHGYFTVLVLTILFLWLRPRGLFARR